MITATTAKAPLHQRAMHELKEVVFITLYLYVTLGAVILMKTAALHTQGVESPLGHRHRQGRVLAKFMLLGEAMKIGGRTTSGPLIWPTLRKAFGLLVLLIIMNTIEEAVVGLFHGKSIAASLGELLVLASRKRSPGTSSCCWCSSRIAPSGSSARRSAKAGWRRCSLSGGSQSGAGNGSRGAALALLA